METTNTFKYDDITLMQYVDGELDKPSSLGVEKALQTDKVLQSRLEELDTTRKALISLKQSNEIPQHINSLIDNYAPTKKQNYISRLVKKYPFKTSIISAILASLVTLQGAISVLVGGGAALTATQLATRGVNIEPDKNLFLDMVGHTDSQFIATAKSNTFATAKSNTFATAKSNTFDSEIIEMKFVQELSFNPTMKEMVIKLPSRSTHLSIAEEFVNQKNKPCKLAQVDGNYLLACRDGEHWSLVYPDK